jgi:hypothetical protein
MKYAEKTERTPVKNETLYVETAEDVTYVKETAPVKQGKLVMGFRLGMKDRNDDYAAKRIMSDVFGGNPNSKLFKVVREEMSLCYYCSSRMLRAKGIMLVQSGIESFNEEKAKTAILDQLEEIKKGNFTEEDLIPDIVEKRIDINYGYYQWEAPNINGKTFASRVSSPLIFDPEGLKNPLSQKEIFVPEIPNIDTGVIRQLIGNFGGYANKEYYDDTNIIMLGDSTLENLKRGIKDEIIIEIENKYNKSNSKIFNIQFTCESDFINWVERRMGIYPDESTIALLEKYQKSPKM